MRQKFEEKINSLVKIKKDKRKFTKYVFITMILVFIVTSASMVMVGRALTEKSNVNKADTGTFSSDGVTLSLNNNSIIYVNSINGKPLKNTTLNTTVIDGDEKNKFLSKLSSEDTFKNKDIKFLSGYNINIKDKDISILSGDDSKNFKIKVEFLKPIALSNNNDIVKVLNINDDGTITDITNNENTKVNMDDSSKGLKSVNFISKPSSKVIFVEYPQNVDNKNSTLNLATKSANNSISFENYIEHVIVSKEDHGRWVVSNQFNNGDKVRVEIDYRLPSNVLNGQQRHMHYRLPDGLKPLNDQNGRVISRGKEVGNYTIDKDGNINISFNKNFLSSGGAIDGSIQFQGKVYSTNGGTKNNVNFGKDKGSISVLNPKVEHYDIDAKKTGSINKDKTKATYEITVSTKDGTESNVNVSDYINKWDSKNVSYDYDKNSLVIKKIGPNGKESIVNSNSYSIDWKNSNGTGFNISNLPKLNAGEKYVIDYGVNVKGDLSNPTTDGIAKLTNNVCAYSGNYRSDGRDAIKWLRDVRKTGSYDKNTGLVTWTITINPNNKNLAGWSFTDTPNESIVGKVIMHKSGTGQQQEIPVTSGNTISYKFPQTSDTSTYTVVYSTKPADNVKTATNTVNLSGDTKESAEANVGIVRREWSLRKTHRDDPAYNLIPGKNLLENNWCVDAVLPSGKLNEFTYQDIILNAKNQNNLDLGPASQYAIASELEKDFISNLYIRVDANNYYNYNGDGKEVLYDRGKESDDISIKVHYYDKNNKEVPATDSTTPITRFTVTVTPKKGIDFEAQSLVIAKYRTFADLSKINPGDTISSCNVGNIGDLDSGDTITYTKIPKLVKQVFTGTKYGADRYKPGETTEDYDSSKGQIKYRVLLNTDESDNGNLVLTDTLPSGTKIVGNSLKARFYINDDCLLSSNYCGTTFVDGKNPSYTVENKDGKQILKINIKNYKFTKNYSRIAVLYTLDVTGDDFWKNINDTSKEYTNQVSFDNQTSSTVTRINRPIKQVQKFGEQLDINGNPAVNSDGTVKQGAQLTSNIRYSIIVNPAGKDLNKNSDVLVLNDVLKGADGFDPIVNINSIKLYKYDANKKDHKGALLNNSIYSVSYDVKDSKIVAKIPDGLACVLEYTYKIDPDFAGNLNLTNSVSLDGQWSSKNQVSLKEVSSSAVAVKKSITIYKVDSQNFNHILPGTEFELSYYDSQKGKWVVKNDKVVVGPDGTIKWDLSVSKPVLNVDCLYRLTETKSLPGYSLPKQPYYFIWSDEFDEKNLAYSNSGANKAGVSMNNINIFRNMGGTDYITNDYSRLTVDKVWMNDSGSLITPPSNEDVKVKLFRFTENNPSSKEQVGGIVELNKDDNWTYSWDNLPKKDSSGHNYLYKVEEIPIAGYQASYINNEGIQNGDIKIINTVNGFELPETGGTGTTMYFVFGFSLIFLSALLCFKKYRGANKI